MEEEENEEKEEEEEKEDEEEEDEEEKEKREAEKRGIESVKRLAENDSRPVGDDKTTNDTRFCHHSVINFFIILIIYSSSFFPFQNYYPTWMKRKKSTPLSSGMIGR